MSGKISVGVVQYLNAKPLILGMEECNLLPDAELVLDYPSRLANRLRNGELDIALLPVASIPTISEANLFSRYGIASLNEVASVCLFSDVPVEEIKSVFLDYQSMTSVALLKILMKEWWHITPVCLPAPEDYISSIHGTRAGLIIGDRALLARKQFAYCYDLASIWNKLTGLPFVFATWIANKDLPVDFIRRFEEANEWGLHRIRQLADAHPFEAYDLYTYYTENISYRLTDELKKGMHLFLEKLEQY